MGENKHIGLGLNQHWNFRQQLWGRRDQADKEFTETTRTD